MRLRYGTRGSALAVAQADRFAEELKALHPGLGLERVVIQTSGDRFSLARPQAVPGEEPENVKALFVKELEEDLLCGAIDLAVHSSKDLPGELPPGLSVAAFPRRADPHDVYIGTPRAPRWKDVQAGSRLRVATAALRRQIQLRLCAPGVEFVSMRGNVDTRLRKLGEGAADGMVLAKAGLERLGLGGMDHEVLPEGVVVPAPGQGALAVEARADRQDVLELLAAVDHPSTRLEVECERLFLGSMGGGCRTPLGAWARCRQDAIDFQWFWADEKGQNPRRGSFSCARDASAFASRARELAEGLRRV
jgi:hydroxymethylbilane synthase